MTASAPRLHYAWIVAAVTFVILLVGDGIRATPSVLMVPLETEFGWNRTAISFAVAINIALFGLIGPFAASVMNRFGVRRVLLAALALLAAAVAGTTVMRTQWHLVVLWGILVIGTHLIAACHDHGIAQVRAAQLLAVMGIFDILGTTASGWLTDRYSSRHLLFGSYTLRGLSLLWLPFTLEQGTGLGWFAVFYGLDWIATVPPTVRLTTEALGRENTGVVYGWIGASHQIGASLAAFGAGAIRTALGDYQGAFWIAGLLCICAGAPFLTIGRRVFQPQPALTAAAQA